MILPSGQYLPSLNADLSERMGRSLSPENAAERCSAAEQMRHQLWMLDPSERRMSIEDYAAALLEKSACQPDA